MCCHNDFVFRTGLANCAWTQKLSDGLQVALTARICELLHSFGPVDLCMCCVGLSGLCGHFVSPLKDVFSKLASHTVGLKMTSFMPCWRTRTSSIVKPYFNTAINHQHLTYLSCRFAFLTGAHSVKS
jgi:hypothetical protein